MIFADLFVVLCRVADRGDVVKVLADVQSLMSSSQVLMYTLTKPGNTAKLSMAHYGSACSLYWLSMFYMTFQSFHSFDRGCVLLRSVFQVTLLPYLHQHTPTYIRAVLGSWVILAALSGSLC